MAPTLLNGDYILVDIFNYPSFHEDKNNFLYKKPRKIKLNEIIVFKAPFDYSSGSSYTNKKSDQVKIKLVKRCTGLPGSTFAINYKFKSKVDTFRKESFEDRNFEDFLNLSTKNISYIIDIEKYKDEEMVIPAAGLKFSNNPLYKKVYKRLKLVHEPNRTSQTITKNYYFMEGDNNNSSIDSKYWGLVPEDHIIGKAKLILFSFNEYGKFRTNRMFKYLK